MFVHTLTAQLTLYMADTRSKVFDALIKLQMLNSATEWENEARTDTVLVNIWDNRAKTGTVLINAARFILPDPNVELNTSTFQSLGIRPFKDSSCSI